MHLLVAGLRYTNASISLREQVVFACRELPDALARLMQYPDIHECAILTTCNRTEVVVAGTVPPAVLRQRVWEFFRNEKQFDPEQVPSAVFALQDAEAIDHLFRVAAGLDSLILGESQILGQVKDMLRVAQQAKTVGLYLDRLLKAAISAGKRVRSVTGITQRDDSVSRAAYERAKALLPGLLDQPIVVVGGGKMAEILLALLQQDAETAGQPLQVTLVNRSEERLLDLCRRFGFRGATWETMGPALTQAAVVFVATGAPHTLIWPETLGLVEQPKLVLDISVPRNVDPAVGQLPGITLLNTDDLAGYQGYSPETEQRICQQANALIAEALDEFTQWLQTLPAQKTMARLRSKLDAIRQQELANLGPAYQETLPLLDELSRLLMNKWLHEPTVRLKQGDFSAEELTRQLQLLETLFGLEPLPTTAASASRGPVSLRSETDDATALSAYPTLGAELAGTLHLLGHVPSSPAAASSSSSCQSA